MSPTSYQTAPPRGEVLTSYRSIITGIHAAAEMCHHTISNSLHHLHHRVKCVIRMAPRIGNLTGRMLTPSVRRRWFYAGLTLLKLALLTVLLRGMIEVLPGEGLPLATGILLFVAAILLEALRLGLRGSEPPAAEDP